MKTLLIAAIICSGFSILSKGQTKTYVFATYTYATNTRMQNLGPLVNWLAEKSGLSLQAKSYPGVQALAEAIRDGSVDFAMMNTSGYLVLQRNDPNKAIPMVNLDPGYGPMTNYGGCLIARRQSGITTMKDVQSMDKKYSLALVSSTSTSGNLVPRLILNSHGIARADSAFHLSYSGTHRQVVEDVLSGKADLGGCGCAETDSARLNPLFADNVVLLESFNDIPLGPIVYRSQTDTVAVRLLSTLLLTIHQDNPVAFQNFLNGWTEFRHSMRFRPVSDYDYDSFRKMFGDNSLLWKQIE